MKKSIIYYSTLVLFGIFFIISYGSAEADDKKARVLSFGQWDREAKAKYSGSDTKMANALAKEGWEITQLAMGVAVLNNTGKPHQAKVLSVSQWDREAKAKHGGSDTKMANAFAKEGWEITQLTREGIVLKK